LRSEEVAIGETIVAFGVTNIATDKGSSMKILGR
jgi:hypothetical protein